MKYVFQFFKNHYLFILFSLVYLLIYFWKLDSIPMIAMDEGWNTFHVAQLWLNQTHGLTSNVFNPIFFVYYYFLYLWVSIFEISLFSVRSLSVFIGLFSIIGLYQILSRYIKSKILIYLGLTCFVMTNIAVITFRWGRPEGLVLAFLIWVILFWIKALELQKARYFLISGFFMSLMVLAHPYSLSVVLAILCCSIFFRNVSVHQFAYFFLGACISIPIIFIKISFQLNFDFHNFFEIFRELQFFSRFQFGEPSKGIIENFTYFWQTYTLGIKRLYILLFEIGIMILSFFRYKDNKLIRNMSFLGLATFIIGIIFITPFRRRYMGIVMVFSIITTLLVINNEKKTIKKVIIIFFVLYMINNILGNAYLVYKQYQNSSYSTLSKQLNQFIPQTAKVVAPIEFWIALQPRFILTDISDQYKNRPIQEYLDNKIEISVISSHFKKNYSPTTGESAIGYQLHENSFHNKLFRLKDDKSWEKIKKFNTAPYDTIYIYRKGD